MDRDCELHRCVYIYISDNYHLHLPSINFMSCSCRSGLKSLDLFFLWKKYEKNMVLWKCKNIEKIWLQKWKEVVLFREYDKVYPSEVQGLAALLRSEGHQAHQVLTLEFCCLQLSVSRQVCQGFRKEPCLVGHRSTY